MTKLSRRSFLAGISASAIAAAVPVAAPANYVVGDAVSGIELLPMWGGLSPTTLVISARQYEILKNHPLVRRIAR